MKHTTFIFAGIMSAVIGNAYATGENTVTSKSYVDSVFQTKIPASSTTLFDEPVRSLVSTTDTPGVVGQVGLAGLDLEAEDFSGYDDFNDYFGDYNGYLEMNSVVPSYALVADELNTVHYAIFGRQIKIPASGYLTTEDENGGNGSGNIAGSEWLSSSVKGTGLVTKTDTEGNVGERKIFEATDVSGYHAQALSQTEKDIQDISIPTVGAMMTAISNGVNAATPTGTPNTIANYGANGELDSGIATYTGAATYNATNDSAKIPTMAGVATYAQAKMTCAGWPDGVAHTDENCWLWNKN